MKKHSPWRFAATLLVVAVAAVVLYFAGQQPSAPASDGLKKISITIVYPDGTEETSDLETTADYLLEALASVADIDGEESAQYGYTLYTVNSVTADFTENNAYWAIYVDGSYGQNSISQEPLKDGSAYTVAYATY